MFPALYLRVIEGDEQTYFRSVLATNVFAELPNPDVKATQKPTLLHPAQVKYCLLWLKHLYQPLLQYIKWMLVSFRSKKRKTFVHWSVQLRTKSFWWRLDNKRDGWKSIVRKTERNGRCVHIIYNQKHYKTNKYITWSSRSCSLGLVLVQCTGNSLLVVYYQSFSSSVPFPILWFCHVKKITLFLLFRNCGWTMLLVRASHAAWPRCEEDIHQNIAKRIKQTVFAGQIQRRELCTLKRTVV